MSDKTGVKQCDTATTHTISQGRASSSACHFPCIPNNIFDVFSPWQKHSQLLDDVTLKLFSNGLLYSPLLQWHQVATPAWSTEGIFFSWPDLVVGLQLLHLQRDQRIIISWLQCIKLLSKCDRQTAARDATCPLMHRCWHYGVNGPGSSEYVISSVFVLR